MVAGVGMWPSWNCTIKSGDVGRVVNSSLALIWIDIVMGKCVGEETQDSRCTKHETACHHGV